MIQDQQTSIAQLKQTVEDFVQQRDWHQFHSPKNLSMALAVEVAELMEHFQWIDGNSSREIASNKKKIEQVEEELADVLCYTLAIANELKIDLSSALEKKMIKNRLKYPAEKFRGRYGEEDHPNEE